MKPQFLSSVFLICSLALPVHSAPSGEVCLSILGQPIFTEQIETVVERDRVLRERVEAQGAFVMAPSPVPGWFVALDHSDPDNPQPGQVLDQPARYAPSQDSRLRIEFLHNTVWAALEDQIQFTSETELQALVDLLTEAAGQDPNTLNSERRDRMVEVVRACLRHNTLSLATLEHTEVIDPNYQPLLDEIRESIRCFNDMVPMARWVISSPIPE